jgi:hypothetical protein
MSNPTENFDENFDDLASALDANINENVERDALLNIQAFADEQVNQVRLLKAMRKEMVSKRNALDKSIKIVGKRIDIALEALKIIQKPE